MSEVNFSPAEILGYHFKIVKIKIEIVTRKLTLKICMIPQKLKWLASLITRCALIKVWVLACLHHNLTFLKLLICEWFAYIKTADR